MKDVGGEETKGGREDEGMRRRHAPILSPPSSFFLFPLPQLAPQKFNQGRQKQTFGGLASPSHLSLSEPPENGRAAKKREMKKARLRQVEGSVAFKKVVDHCLCSLRWAGRRRIWNADILQGRKSLCVRSLGRRWDGTGPR